MTNDTPTPPKKAATEPIHQVRISSRQWEALKKVAAARAIGLPLLVERLIDKGLELLVDPVLFDDDAS